MLLIVRGYFYSLSAMIIDNDMVALNQNISAVYALFIETVFDGLTPSWWDEDGFPVTYATERDAQLEIVENLSDRIIMFKNEERDFDDTITIEDRILPVRLFPDGTIQLENGLCFGKRA